MDVLAELRRRFAEALAPLTDDLPTYLDLVRPAQEARFGDYQANMAMPLAKALKRPPRQIAENLTGRLKIDDLAEPPEIAGPGFINVRLRTGWVRRSLEKLAASLRLDVPLVKPPRRFVLDYSAPNVAKPMHVGHLRSTVIGDSLYRLLGFLGHDVISDNHIGDWGTQFGMILYGYKHFLDEAAYTRDPVAELARLYRKTNDLAERDPEVAEQARQETARLHAGDAENRRLWTEFMPHCRAAMDRMYARLGVHFDHTLGESFYAAMLDEVVGDLRARGIVTESDGAWCIFPEHGSGPPAIVRKTDGAFTYMASDLATIRYRIETFHPDAILYVVDARQSLHFEQLFEAARRWGYGDVELQHIKFGTVLGEDGRPFRTRAGDTIGLESLLDEAVERARRVVDENSPHLPPEERARVAEIVGLGAIKYADLSQNRTSDYVFSWEKMIAMQGNTATYLQYAYARNRSIFRTGGVDVAALRESPPPVRIETAPERALAVALLRFAETLASAASEYRPNLLTNYLFDLANSYSTFYKECPVLKAEPASLRAGRLLLCDLTARTLHEGLALLGISTVEQM